MRVSDAIPTPRLLLKNSSYLVRKEAVLALGKIDGLEALGALRTACEDPIASVVRDIAKRIISTNH
jgi:HEAT repeat protein